MSKLDRTNCEEAFRRLNDFLDRRMTPADLKIMEEHLEICAWCAREFNFEASVLHGVKRKVRQLEAPEDLVSKILSRLPTPPEERI
jgi:anti-sigma factor (TIGR02949 family)